MESIPRDILKIILLDAMDYNSLFAVRTSISLLSHCCKLWHETAHKLINVVSMRFGANIISPIEWIEVSGKPVMWRNYQLKSQPMNHGDYQMLVIYRDGKGIMQIADYIKYHYTHNYLSVRMSLDSVSVYDHNLRTRSIKIVISDLTNAHIHLHETSIGLVIKVFTTKIWRYFLISDARDIISEGDEIYSNHQYYQSNMLYGFLVYHENKAYALHHKTKKAYSIRNILQMTNNPHLEESIIVYDSRTKAYELVNPITETVITLDIYRLCAAEDAVTIKTGIRNVNFNCVIEIIFCIARETDSISCLK